MYKKASNALEICNNFEQKTDSHCAITTGTTSWAIKRCMYE